MKNIFLVALSTLLFTSCNQEEITFRNPIKIEPEESVRGNWTEEDLDEARNVSKEFVKVFGMEKSEGADEVCECITRTFENRYDGPNDPTATEKVVESIMTNCVDSYYEPSMYETSTDEPGGC
jgi:hypothetical protein